MSARKKDDPDDELAALHEKRMALALRRDAHSGAQGAAERVIEGSADRRSAALLAEARGQKPDPTVEQVDSERRAAEAAVIENRERAAALRQVEQEVEQEVEAVIDRYPEVFIAKAEAASEAAAEAIANAT